MESDRCGIYVTASYYPLGQGWLAEDKDSVDARRHSHDMLLLTEKGQSYMEGGLYVVTRPSEKIDVVSQVILSDVIFFDGSRPHGVEIVSGRTGLGRL